MMSGVNVVNVRRMCTSRFFARRESYVLVYIFLWDPVTLPLVFSGLGICRGWGHSHREESSQHQGLVVLVWSRPLVLAGGRPTAEVLQ